MRFRKESDRWTAFASVLLKSVAFHRSTQELLTINHLDDEVVSELFKGRTLAHERSDLLPIVSLPRTKYNRPYIPCLTKEQNNDTVNRDEEADDGDNENQFAKVNVSHQYPHIALVQSTSCMNIGIDLVVFSFHWSEFTPTTNDFLQAFESSFTPFEWERIQYSCTGDIFKSRRQRDDESKLIEFFVRWSMKEAYTKALGLGMHIEFSSFETRLLGIDDNTTSDKGIWSTIMSAINGEQLSNVNDELLNQSKDHNMKMPVHKHSILGKVQSKAGNTKSNENQVWEFSFIPIKTSDCNWNSHDACCCICRGPFIEHDGPNESTRVQIEKIDLINLIKLHMSSKRGE
jgi:phosphopantetheinyl transferase (holo-ACP synthase)